MDKYTTYVGMDVHARSVIARALNKRTGEQFSKRFGAGYSAEEIAEWIFTLEGPALCAYESGVTGFYLARQLYAIGIDCEVIAISTLATSLKDRKEKCDKYDARAILREMTNPLKTYSTVYIPDERTEAERDLVRTRDKAALRWRRARQELSSFLLRHGYVWNERTASGNIRLTTGHAYKKWLDTISFAEPAAEATFAFLRRHAKSAKEELDHMDALVEEIAQRKENKPFIDALCLLKGVNKQSAMMIKAEVGCFSRFSSGRKVSSWIGCVPTNHSSGAREVHGRITKAGNKYLRRALVEGVSSLPSWSSSTKKPQPKEGVSASVLAKADEGNERLCKRYHHLKNERGKQMNKVKIAIANEMMRWLWVIGLMVEQEQEMRAH